MYDNLSTQQNYVLDASPAALGLASNEFVTEFMVSFGIVPGSFRQVEAAKVYCNVVSWLTGGNRFVNQADVGGGIHLTYEGESAEFSPFISLKDGELDIGSKGLAYPELCAPHKSLPPP